MKSVISTEPHRAADQFPKLMQGSSGDVYRMKSPREGIRVATGSRSVGTEWEACGSIDADLMKDFHGTVTLSND